MSNLSGLVLAADAAALTGQATFVIDGGAIYRLIHTEVYARRDDRWRLTHLHTTRAEALSLRTSSDTDDDGANRLPLRDRAPVRRKLAWAAAQPRVCRGLWSLPGPDHPPPP